MGIQQVLRMNDGDGQSSYARNSSVQRAAILKTRPLIQESIQALISSSKPMRLSIADLGCAMGPNSLLPTTMVLDAAHELCQRRGLTCIECQAFLNDLPENDFNTIFRTIPSFYKKLAEDKGQAFAGSCFIAAVPRLFYGRLFPTDSLNFVYCANSLHWRSQVPPQLEGKTNNLNKGNIALGMTSPPAVFEAYFSQFRKDLKSFLKSRAQEVVAGGRMVLEVIGRKSSDPFAEECYSLWDDMAHALRDLVQEVIHASHSKQGRISTFVTLKIYVWVIEEEKISSFNFPVYAPHVDELKEVIHVDGSFEIIQCEETAWDAATDFGVDAIRAVVEPLLKDHFGHEVMDELFKKLRDHLPRDGTHGIVCVIASLSKKMTSEVENMLLCCNEARENGNY